MRCSIEKGNWKAVMVIGKKKNFFETAALFCATASCLVIPFASSLLSLFSILTLIFWIISGKIKEIPSITRSNPIAFLTILLFGFFVIGLFYTAADISEALAVFKKYRELIFVPILISLLRDHPIARKNCEYGFIFGCIILLLISYSMYFSILPSARYGHSIVYHITHSYFMAILAFWAIHKAIDSYQYRYLWIVIYFLAVFNLFYIAPGRTGMLVFLALMVLFLIQRLSVLQQFVGLFLLTLLLSIIYTTSDNFSSRSNIALKEIQNYHYGETRTSLGMRFDWWVNSIILIKQKPLLGHGTGSFEEVHDELIADTAIQGTDNPHNEYLFIGVQLGIIGLATFLLIFLAQIKYSFKLEKPDKRFVQGVVVAMAVGCLMNSFLFDSHQGHFWAFLSGLYFSSYPGNHLPLRSLS
ncbi:O-antigen ligase family protein [Desulfopila inferna]|uniref:O-antigen ligase family protein n=1 Tax=Desulfopila inferna TaxID=468528 RepID=UPI001965EDE5|nr:O-antigen ligase family protein [Desulfopila inferna]MBM9602672.1 O-antigen ligase family protein [Desulfopila inferna]